MADLVLAIRLTADGKGLVGEVRLSREELEKLKKTTEDGTGASKRASEEGKRHGAVLADLGRNARAAALTIGALTTAIAFQTKRWIDDAASMERWHQVTGKSVESLAALKFVAEQTNVSFDLLMATYQRLPRSIVEGLGENSEAARAFKALMIDPRQLKANDEGMLLIIDRLRQVEDRGTRAAIAQMIFKQRGEDLLLWVNQGAEGIRRLTQEGERWATVTGTDAQRADELKNKINTLTHATDALAKSVAEQVIPQLNTMIERMLEGARAGGGLRGAIAGFLTGTDLDKWNADFFRAVERLGAAQSNSERLQGSSGFMRQGIARARAELEAARAEVERLQAIKPIMFPEVPEAPTTGAAAGGRFKQPTLRDLEPPDTTSLGFIRSLQDEAATLGMTTEQAKLYQATQLGMTGVSLQVVKAALNKIATYRQETLALETHIALQREAEAEEQARVSLGQRANQLRNQALDDSRQGVQAAKDNLSVAQKELSLMGLGEEKRRTQLAEFKAEIEARQIILRLQQQQVPLGEEDIERIRERTRETALLQSQTQAITDQMKRNDKLGHDMGFTFSSAFEDAIVQGNRFRDVLQGLAQDILRIFVRRRVTEPLTGMLASAFTGAFTGGGTPGAGAGDIPSTAFNAQHGLDFTVGGAGGVDSQFIPLWATPGERVRVETAQQQRGSSGATFYVDMRGASLEAVARLEAFVRRMDATLERRAVTATFDAQMRGARP